MMIKIKLDEVLKDKNVSLTELSEAVDITIANLSILKPAKQKRFVLVRLKLFVIIWSANRGILLLMKRIEGNFILAVSIS